MLALQFTQTDISRRASILSLFFGLTVVHLVFLAYDLANPTRFLNADRAVDRLAAMKQFIAVVSSGGDIAEYLSSHGNPGDYVIHAALYALGGPMLIIVVQIALLMAATAAVYALALKLFESRNASIASATIFAFLPHNLVFCHVLSSEALFNPLVVFGFYFSCDALTSKSRNSAASYAGMAFGLASLIRPLLFVWPLFIAIAMLVCRIRTARIVSFLAWSTLPMLCWMGFIWLQTGAFSEGASERDLNHNLYSRIYLASERLNVAEKNAARDRFLSESTKTAGLGAYAAFCAAYPATCVKHLSMDTVGFVAKSGVEKVTIEYLDLIGADKRSTAEARYDFQDKEKGWRYVLETGGAVAVLRYFMERNAAVAISSAIGAVGILTLWVLAGIGAFAIYRANLEKTRYVACVTLIAFPLYIFSVCQFVDLMQSRHRAPAEFALCLLAMAGLYRKTLWVRGERA